MNRAALIKNINSLADIPYSEGELFIEILLRKIQEEKKPGQIYKLTGSEFFKYTIKNGQVIFEFTNDTDVLNFVLPEEKSFLKYSLHNLSIGKPVFPTSSKQHSYSLIHNPEDLLNTLDAKAERILELLVDSVETEELAAEPQSDYNDNIVDELTDSTFDEIAELTFQDSEELLPEEKEFSSTKTEEDFNTETIHVLNETNVEEPGIVEGELLENSLPEEVVEVSSGSFIDNDEIVSDILINPEGISPEDFMASVEKPEETIKDFDNPEMEIISGPLELEPPQLEISDSITSEEERISANDVVKAWIKNEVIGDELRDQDNESVDKSEKPDSKVDYEQEEFFQSIPLQVNDEAEVELITENQLTELPASEVVFPEVEQNSENLSYESTLDLADLREFEPDEEEINLTERGEDLKESESIFQSKIDDELGNAENFLADLNTTPPVDTEGDGDKKELSFLELADKYTESDEDGTSEIVENINDENTGELLSNIIDNLDETSEIHPSEEKTDAENFQRVKSLTREFFNMSDFEQKQNMLTWDFGESEQIDKDIKAITKSFDEPVKPPAKSKEGFTMVQGKKATMEWTPGTFPDMEKSLETPDEEELVEEINLQIADRSISESMVTETVRVSRREKKKNYTFIIIVGFITIIGLAVLAYYKLSGSNEVTQFKRDINPIIIERNDRVPVMIGGESEKEGTGTPAFEEQKNVHAETGQELIKVADGLYQKGNMFYIQVSSWQTKWKAEKEAERYQVLGYQTDIQSSVLKSGLWYRLLVGEFNTAVEAEEFINKN